MGLLKKAKSEYDRESYAYWKSQQRCVRCHKQDAFTLAGRARCAECAEKNREESARHRAARKETAYACTSQWYRRMKEEQRCVLCAKPVEDPEHYSTCERCRAKRRAHDTERRIQAGRYAKSDKTVCGICNRRPVMAGKRTCPECYAQNLRNLERANAAKDNRLHPWSRMAHAEAVERRAAR